MRIRQSAISHLNCQLYKRSFDFFVGLSAGERRSFGFTMDGRWFTAANHLADWDWSPFTLKNLKTTKMEAIVRRGPAASHPECRSGRFRKLYVRSVERQSRVGTVSVFVSQGESSSNCNPTAIRNRFMENWNDVVYFRFFFSSLH